MRSVESGALALDVSWESLDEHCMYGGRYNAGTGADDNYQWWGWHCAIPLSLPSAASYIIEVVTWADQAGDELAKLGLAATLYQEGDTWYRDMRTPGFGVEQVPDGEDSLQWLGRKIVADPRFAEATVKFWWPALMGSEVAEPPAEEGDAEFEGQLLGANAQGAEVRQLAAGFRQGFNGRSRYNLKDLLVEMVLSKWFRADALSYEDPVREIALRDAGARRLLTPEELAHKTAVLTGFQWGRRINNECWGDCDARPNNLTDQFRLLYGGIDSDGITERARNVTSVMAGVAKTHATQVSCPIIMRELYLLPSEERKLFANVDQYVSPISGFGDLFEIEAGSQAERETLSLEGSLIEGSHTVRISFLNDYGGGSSTSDRNVRLDRLDVRDAAGRVVGSYELETVEPEGDCKGPAGDHFGLWCERSLDVPIHVPKSGHITIEVVAWADQAGDEFPRLDVRVVSDAERSSGAQVIRKKLVERYDILLGIQVTPYSPDVEVAYQLFIDVWKRKLESEYSDVNFRGTMCDWDNDHFFFDGILNNSVIEHDNENGPYYDFDWGYVNDFVSRTVNADPQYIAQTWITVLAYLLGDYRYLYL